MQVKLQYTSEKLNPWGEPYRWHHVVSLDTALDVLLVERMRWPGVTVEIVEEARRTEARVDKT